MLEEALAYPTSGENGLARVVIGGFLLLLATVFQIAGAFLLVLGIGAVFLIVGYGILLPAYGYLIAVLAAASRGEERPPEFDDWGRLTAIGLKGFLAAIVYTIPAVVVITFFVAVFSAGLGALAGRSDVGAIVSGIGVLGLLLSGILYLLILYVLPAALTSVGREDRISAAFDFGTIWTVITDDAYIVATVLAFGVSVVAAILTFFAFLTIVLGVFLVLLGPFIQFWLYMVFAHMYGRAFDDAVTDESPASPSPVS